VAFDTDPGLKQGEFDCRSSLVEAPSSGGAPPVEAPAAPPEEPPPAAETRPAELILLERGKPSRTFPLGKDRVIIGRLAESDIVVADAGASRRHAEVRREDSGYVIADLGSTNGTMVNHTSIGERTLEEGDRITIGRTVLEFRRR